MVCIKYLQPVFCDHHTGILQSTEELFGSSLLLLSVIFFLYLVENRANIVAVIMAPFGEERTLYIKDSYV